jgi:Predicted RNA-binding protein containing a PIN domain
LAKNIDVCVVTSDSLEQQLIFQRGARRMLSIEFYFEVEEINTKINKKVEKNIQNKEI